MKRAKIPHQLPMPLLGEKIVNLYIKLDDFILTRLMVIVPMEKDAIRYRLNRVTKGFLNVDRNDAHKMSLASYLWHFNNPPMLAGAGGVPTMSADRQAPLSCRSNLNRVFSSLHRERHRAVCRHLHFMSTVKNRAGEADDGRGMQAGMNRAVEQLERLGNDRLRRWGPWLLAVLALALYLPGNNLIPLLDRDEPRFAQASREMMERGDWVVPTFNGQNRFDKPILIYWLMRGAYAVFGVNEFAARLPSALCAAALVALTCSIGTRWFSAVTGFLAGFTMMTCAQLLLQARSATADMPMVLCVLAAHWALWELLQVGWASSPSAELDGQDAHPTKSKWWWLFWGAVGVGFLAKGPVAILLPGLTLLFYRFALWRQPVPWRRLRPEWGIPVALAIIAAWGIPALVRTHGEFWRVGIGRHVVARGLASFEGHGAFAPYYYFVTALVSLFPWIALAGDGIRATRQHWNAKNAFLVSWVAGTYLLFTLYRTKLPHYVLPCFPALFLLLGQARQPRWTAWFWIVTGAGLLAAVAVAVVTRGMAIGLAGILAALAVLAINWRQGRVLWSLLPVAVSLASVVALGVTARSLSPSVTVGDATRFLPAHTRCGWSGYEEPSLVFYTGRRWGPVGDLKTFLATPGPCVAVCQLRETRLEDVVKQRPPKPAQTFAADGVEHLDLAGLNMARVSWVELRLFYRPQ